MKRVSLPFALLPVVAAVLSASAWESGSQATGRATLRHLLDHYRHDDADGVVSEFSMWDQATVRAEASAAPATYPARELAALALLHTEAGLEAGTLGSRVNPARDVEKPEWRLLPWPPGTADRQEEFFLGRADNVRRKLADLGAFDAHLDCALRDIRSALQSARTGDDPALIGFCRSWFITVLSISVTRPGVSLFLARGPLERFALVEFGEDPEVLLTVGSVIDKGPDLSMDVVKGVLQPAPPLAQRPSRLTKTSQRSLTEEQLRPEAVFRHVLELDPSLVEARLRLGRLLFLLDRVEEARVELTRALQDSRDQHHPFASYLSALFLGELEVTARRPGAAVRALQQAVSMDPDGRSGRLALGHALIEANRPDDGWAAIRGLFDAQADHVDPWTRFDQAQSWQQPGRLRSMRTAVRQWP